MPTPRVKEGFLEEEMSDVRLEGTGVHQAKIERRVLGRGDRGLQRPERMIELDWSVTEMEEIYREQVAMEVSFLFSPGGRGTPHRASSTRLKYSDLCLRCAREPWEGCEQGRGGVSSGT